MEPVSRHQCMIYDGPPSRKLQSLAAILKHKMDEGYRCLYLNSAPMVAGMRSTLAAMNIDVAHEVAKARIVLSSEPVTNGIEFNSAALLSKLEDSLDQAINDGYKGLWATGDMSWEFGPRQDFSKLLEYELGLEELFRRRPEMCGVCQYHRDTLPAEAMRQGLLTHNHIVINQTLSQINPHYLVSPRPAEPNTIHEMDRTIAILCGQPD
jgi:MEDS: MEthanogen/methylotroph, DcmR Sensory domain